MTPNSIEQNIGAGIGRGFVLVMHMTLGMKLRMKGLAQF